VQIPHLYFADYQRAGTAENKKAKENFPFASFPFIQRIIFVL
jgi:hypothetical protein